MSERICAPGKNISKKFILRHIALDFVIKAHDSFLLAKNAQSALNPCTVFEQAFKNKIIFSDYKSFVMNALKQFGQTRFATQYIFQTTFSLTDFSERQK